jgi:HSP20 family molecular chaperone IbpA
LSAKWRRNKRDSKKFNIFKVFNKGAGKRTSRNFQGKRSEVKRQSPQYRHRPRKFSGERKLRAPAPLIDVLEGNDDISVISEFAGFSKDSLRISLKNQRLILSAEGSYRKYRKSLNLPKRVIPSTIRTTYKNGVLEIRLKKSVEEKAIDRVTG